MTLNLKTARIRRFAKVETLFLLPEKGNASRCLNCLPANANCLNIFCTLPQMMGEKRKPNYSRCSEILVLVRPTSCQNWTHESRLGRRPAAKGRMWLRSLGVFRSLLGVEHLCGCSSTQPRPAVPAPRQTKNFTSFFFVSGAKKSKLAANLVGIL
jgi:hypothetical protein